MDVPIVIAIIGAVSALIAALVSAAAQRSVRRLEQRFAGNARTIAFRTDQLTKLYLPVSMHLRATRALATTHYEADDSTNQEVEHALHEHNKAIVESLLSVSMYVEPDAPEAATIGLLEHLLQWETIYKLKYQEKRSYKHPIWKEIRRLGYSRFPDGAAEHFHSTATELRAELHAQLCATP
jgi:hypothetical protein